MVQTLLLLALHPCLPQIVVDREPTSPPVYLDVVKAEYRRGLCRAHLKLWTGGRNIRPKTILVQVKRLRYPTGLTEGSPHLKEDPLITVYTVPPQRWPKLRPLKPYVVSHELLAFPLKKPLYKGSILWLKFEYRDAAAEPYRKAGITGWTRRRDESSAATHDAPRVPSQESSVVQRPGVFSSRI